MAASIDRADNAKFIEKFRYTIIASQLLSDYSISNRNHPQPSGAPATGHDRSIVSVEGILASVLGALAVAIVLSWILGSGPQYVTRKRLVFLVLLLVALALLGPVYMRRQWLKYRREQSLSEIATFVSSSHDFDSVMSAALSLVQEVELVSRGYRM